MAKSARILVVDDEPDTLELIELTLRTAGHQVKLASGGKEALRAMIQSSYDLILLDIMMPDISGFDMLRVLRQEKTPTPPVIILTARTRAQDRQEGDSLGVSGFLVKPVTRGKLLDAIDEVLGAPPKPDASP